MSFELIKLAVNYELPSSQKIVLIMLASRANDKSGLCCPSLTTLAKDCGMSRRSVIYQLDMLDKSGLVSVVREKNDSDLNFVNKYRLNLAESGSATIAPGSATIAPGSATIALGSATIAPGSATIAPGSATIAPGVVQPLHPKQEYIKQEIKQEDKQEININNPVMSVVRFERSCEKELTLVEAVMPWYRQQGFAEDIDQHFRHFQKRIPTLKHPPRDAAALFRKAIVDDWAGLRAPKVQVPVSPEWAILPQDDNKLWRFVCDHCYPQSLGMLPMKDMRNKLRHEIELRMDMFLDYGKDVYLERRNPHAVRSSA